MASIRAVYRNGQLQLLDPVELAEGQEVQLHILDEPNRVRDALSDLLVQVRFEDDDETLDEVALQQEIDRASQGVTLSDVIIEERRSGR